MSQPSKLTKSLVREAYTALRAEAGRRPGLHRMRQHLGQGSLPVIKRLMNEIDAETLDAVVQRKHRLPDPISQAAQALYAELAEAVDALEQTVENQAAEAVAQAHQARDGALADREALAQTVAAREATIVALTGERDEAQARNAALDAALAAAQQQCQAAENVNEALHQRVNDLKAALTAADCAAAEREQRLRQDIEAERERGRQEREAVEQLRLAAEQRLAAANEAAEQRLSTLRQDVIYFQGQHRTEVDARQALEQENQALRAAHEDQVRAADEALGDAKTQHVVLSEQLATAHGRLEAMSATLVQARKDQQSAQRRIVDLERKLARQRKPATKKKD